MVAGGHIAAVYEPSSKKENQLFLDNIICFLSLAHFLRFFTICTVNIFIISAIISIYNRICFNVLYIDSMSGCQIRYSFVHIYTCI